MDEKVKILLCEDDENLGTLLCEYLIAKGYDAVLCPDGEAGYKEFTKDKFDICVLDVMMPKKDGFTLAQEIRQINSQVPIVFLTARVQKEDVLEGFDKGADDYITKPFSMEELVKRVEAILRRVRGKKNKESTMYKIGRYTFDTRSSAHHRRQTDQAHHQGERAAGPALLAHQRDTEAQRRLRTIWIDDNYFNARSMDVYITSCAST
jgi:DNA-binding response OmpR family regulator